MTWKAGQNLLKNSVKKIQLVGDDLFVTNTKRLAKGIELGCSNSILIKSNQIGTPYGDVEDDKSWPGVAGWTGGYQSSQAARPRTRPSRTWRSPAAAGQIKTGSACRSRQNLASNNQLLRIHEQLGSAAQYGGALIRSPINFCGKIRKP